MSDQILHVNVLDEPGVYKVSTESTTVYYVDTTGPVPQMMRLRGSGPTGMGEHDNTWVDLLELTSRRMITSEPVPGGPDPDDLAPWWLRVGARHRYDFEAEGRNGLPIPDSWIQRVCEAIERVDERPTASGQ